MKTILFTLIISTLSFANMPFEVKRDQVIKLLKNRPKKCPLLNTTKAYAEIYQRLSDDLGRFTNKCYDSNASKLSNIRDEVNNLAAISTEDSNPENMERRMRVSENLQAANAVFTGLESLARQDSCQDDLKSKSFLQSTADTITSVTSLGILTDDGTDIFLAGALISTALRVIDRLFYDPNNWNKAEDRDLFVSLSCSFYDIRRELNELGVFRASTLESRDEEVSLAASYRELEGELKRLQAELKEIPALKDASKSGHFKEQYPNKAMADQFNGLINQYKDKLLTSGSNYPVALQVMDLYFFSREMNGLSLFDSNIFPKDLAEVYLPYAKQVIAGYITSPQVPEDDEVILKVQRDREFLFAFLSIWQERYEERVEKIESDWLTSQGAILDDQLASLNEQIASIDEDIDNLKTRYSIISFRNNKGEFDYDNDGTAVLINLQEKYNETISKIYGSVGKSFVDDIGKFMTREYDFYKKGLEEFDDKGYDKMVSEFLPGLLLLRGCTRAQQLVERWNLAFSWSKMAYDFSMTNIDFFHDFKDSKWLGLSATDNRRLRWDAYSAIHAQILIEQFLKSSGENGYQTEGLEDAWKDAEFAVDSDVNGRTLTIKKTDLKGRNLGSTMIKIALEKGNIDRLEAFIQNSCEEISHFD